MQPQPMARRVLLCSSFLVPRMSRRLRAQLEVDDAVEEGAEGRRVDVRPHLAQRGFEAGDWGGIELGELHAHRSYVLEEILDAPPVTSGKGVLDDGNYALHLRD